MVRKPGKVLSCMFLFAILRADPAQKLTKYLTNKEALTVLCSVVKHAGSGRAREVLGKTRDAVECFSPLLECSTAS